MAAGEVCCPLTKLCVIPGVVCTPPPVCTSSEYCCPDALHCLTPVEPGTLCGGTCVHVRIVRVCEGVAAVLVRACCRSWHAACDVHVTEEETRRTAEASPSVHWPVTVALLTHTSMHTHALCGCVWRGAV